MEEKYIELDTYANMYLDEECEVENYDYDHQTRVFTVPTIWLSKWIEKYSDYDNFFSEYTSDDTMAIYEQAILDGVLISDEIVTY